MQTMIQGYKTIHKHTHTNIALKTHSGAAGSTEILEKSCLREKQHNAQGCYHGDTLFVEDIKCGRLHCLCVRAGTTPGNTGHVLTCTKHTLIEQLIHSLSHSQTSHSQKHTANFIHRHTGNERTVHTLCIQHLGDVEVSLCHFKSVVQIGHWVVLLTQWNKQLFELFYSTALSERTCKTQRKHPQISTRIKIYLIPSSTTSITPWHVCLWNHLTDFTMLLWMDSLQTLLSSEIVYQIMMYYNLGCTNSVTYYLVWIVCKLGFSSH